MHNFSYLRVMSMGGHFFLQTWICMAMIFEPYLGCYGSILSPDLVCCSWDYGLSIKWSSILNRMSGTCSNFQFILLKHITLICQHDKLPLVRWFVWKLIQYSITNFVIDFLKDECLNHVQICTVFLFSSGPLLNSAYWSLNHDVIQVPFVQFHNQSSKLPKFRVHMECLLQIT